MALFTAIGTALGATATTAFATGLATTAAVGGLGAGVWAATQAGSGKYNESNMAQMPNAPAPVAPTQADAAESARLKLDERKRAIAANESVMTNPLGVKDEAEVVRKKLLGG